jgi:hypothetical protein
MRLSKSPNEPTETAAESPHNFAMNDFAFSLRYMRSFAAETVPFPHRSNRFRHIRVTPFNLSTRNLRLLS